MKSLTEETLLSRSLGSRVLWWNSACLVFLFPVGVLASQAEHWLQWQNHRLLMVLSSVSIKFTSKKWVWNYFPAHLLEMGKEPATEELKTLLLQHVLYI